MMTMSNLSDDLVREILSRVPLTSLRTVRSTCKTWNDFSKNQIIGKKAAASKQFLWFMVIGYKVCSLRFDLQGICNGGDLVDPSIKQISKLDQIEISQVFHSDGLLLCVIKNENENDRRLLVWNPYLGQTRWIPSRKSFKRDVWYAFGYDNNNHNHKILRFLDDYDPYYKSGPKNLLFWFELYDFSSDSWRVLDVKPDFDIYFYQSSVSLKGNTYFVVQAKITEDGEIEDFLLCYDFTVERFGQRLSLPFQYAYVSDVILSCVRDEQLAVLCYYRDDETIVIWTTTKIEPNAISWDKFFKVKMTPLNGFPYDFADDFEAGSFFLHEENKVAVVFEVGGPPITSCNQRAYIIGEDGYFKTVTVEEVWSLWIRRYSYPFVFSSYVPSLVQLRSNQRGKGKERVLI